MASPKKKGKAPAKKQEPKNPPTPNPTGNSQTFAIPMRDEPVNNGRQVVTDAYGKQVVIRTNTRRYPKEVWIENAYEFLKLPRYVVAAALENDWRDELTLDEVRSKILSGSN